MLHHKTVGDFFDLFKRKDIFGAYWNNGWNQLRRLTSSLGVNGAVACHCHIVVTQQP